MAAVSGADLLAAAAGAGAGAGSSSLTFKHDDLVYDLALLTALDGHPLDEEALTMDKEAELARVATENTQLLVKKIFELPVGKTDEGPVVRSL